VKVLVCGDRHWINKELIYKILEKLPKDTVIIEGGAKGADLLAKEVAEKLLLEVKEFPAEWGKYSRAAGPLRNREMIKEKPDKVFAFHNNIEKSKGTKDMLNVAKKQGIQTELFKEE
jgi:hypothetical protein